jgi:two-component system sensor histidine kinase YesM
MEEQTLSHIKSLLESGKQLFASEKKDVRGNIGILNINSRIRLLYGDDSGLDIESSKNQFTKVSLLIPARRRITELKIPGTTL